MPPEDYQKVYDDVLDQTENFKNIIMSDSVTERRW